MKKQMLWKTKGMNQDLSVSAFNPEFSFENMNLRLSTNEGNTLMSWVNERGTASVTLVNPDDNSEVTISGTPLGTAILNHQLVIFVHDDNGDVYKDYIYKLSNVEEEDNELKIDVVEQYKGNLGFDVKYPIETLVSFESTDIQKVYWTDYKNQPRMINIANTPRKYTSAEEDTHFNFVPVTKKGSLNVTQQATGGGTFPPGVIQYCYAYFNKYGQHSNIVDVSTLFYLGHPDRGASPEERVGGSFTLSINNGDVDYDFDYIRLYSIQRTSLDATPIVKIIEDIPTSSSTITYTDNGTTGSIIDPTELLYVGGREIRALTMTDKDGTLFLGNIKEVNAIVDAIQAEIDKIPEDKKKPQFNNENSDKYFSLPSADEFYPYKNSLSINARKQTTFKGGEWYRFGFQLQKKSTGEWSEPIYLADAQNDKYPYYNTDKAYHLVEASLDLDLSNIDVSAYERIRPVVVFPNAGEKTVLCQGVVNPTVFNVEDRVNGTPFAQASWYFRPIGGVWLPPTSPGEQMPLAVNAASGHYETLYNQSSVPDDTADYDYFRYAREVEVQGSVEKYSNPYASANVDVHSNTQFFVDQSIVTLNSPDIDFDTDIQNASMDNLHLRIVGAIPISSSASSHSIVTSNDMLETAHNMGRSGWVTEIEITEHNFGSGENQNNVLFTVDDDNKKYGTRLIAGNFWNDSYAIRSNEGDITYDMTLGDPARNGDPESTRHWYNRYETLGDWVISTHNYTVNFFIHPWHRSGSLTNDYRGEEAASVLKTKRESNYLFSMNTYYFSDSEQRVSFPNISSKIHFQENEEVFKIGLPKQKTTTSGVSYYPNVDKTLVNTDGYIPLAETFSDVEYKRYNLKSLGDIVRTPVRMKYKSTSHAVIAFNADDNGDIPITPCIHSRGSSSYGKYIHPGQSYDTFWGDKDVRFKQDDIELLSYDLVNYLAHPGFLWLGELYRDKPKNLFGGTGKQAFRSNKWLIGGEAVTIPSNPSNRKVKLKWSEGDTYYQRYDCLKTYAFTNEDPNQLVEILSFMCETHVNIDGRYDANRGQIVSHSMSPQNFNLVNPVYSQRNNFFTSRKIEDGLDTDYPNQIAYSKTKTSGADVDLWTNVTLGSVLELDGDRGKISSLRRFNDQIIAFQDSAISQILYNESVQISSAQGVPIEIANSGKVQGKRYLSDTIGCSNKWSICNTPSGIYFMDSNNKGIYLFNGQVNDLSGKLGMNSWSKNNIPSTLTEWNPSDFNNFISHYDKLNQEVLFINRNTALAYSEKLGVFTSFYDYGGIPYFCNLDDAGIWIKSDTISEDEDPDHYVPGGTFTTLWKHQAGEYCDFFSTEDYDGHKPYSMTLIGNPEPQVDKIFTNLEFRACVDGDGEPNQNASKFTFYTPFDSLETWNEYQHGHTALSIKNGRSLFKHGGNDSTLIRKFRIWRCDIPRNNMSTDHKTDRMRNPWLYLKLQKNADTDKRAEIHDMMMTYFT